MLGRLLDLDKLDDALEIEVRSDSDLMGKIYDNMRVIRIFETISKRSRTEDELFVLALRDIIVRDLYYKIESQIPYAIFKSWNDSGGQTDTTVFGRKRYEEIKPLFDALQVTNINDLYREFKKQRK